MESTNIKFGVFGKRTCGLLTVSALIMIALADLEITDKLEGICICAISGLSALWCINLALRRSSNIIISTVISIYVCFAFGLKAGLFITIGADSWLTDFYTIGTIAPDELMHAYIISGYGTVSLICGLACATVFAKPGSTPERLSLAPTYRHVGLTLLVSYAILLVKPILQYEFGIGMAGTVDNTLPIPYASGLIAMLIGPSGFAIMNISIFINVAAKRRRIFVLLALCAAIINVVLDLFGGFKASLVLQAIVFSIYGLHFSKGMRSPARRFMYGVILSCVAALLFIYPYVNYYRFGLISGLSSIDALSLSVYFNALG
jgi:hypothetical protein